MELKFEHFGELLEEDEGSNRTFMELKLSLAISARSLPCCSNRTFMKLKYTIKFRNRKIGRF